MTKEEYKQTEDNLRKEVAYINSLRVKYFYDYCESITGLKNEQHMLIEDVEYHLHYLMAFERDELFSIVLYKKYIGDTIDRYYTLETFKQLEYILID